MMKLFELTTTFDQYLMLRYLLSSFETDTNNLNDSSKKTEVVGIKFFLSVEVQSLIYNLSTPIDGSSIMSHETFPLASLHLKESLFLLNKNTKTVEEMSFFSKEVQIIDKRNTEVLEEVTKKSIITLLDSQEESLDEYCLEISFHQDDEYIKWNFLVRNVKVLLHLEWFRMIYDFFSSSANVDRNVNLNKDKDPKTSSNKKIEIQLHLVTSELELYKLSSQQRLSISLKVRFCRCFFLFLL